MLLNIPLYASVGLPLPRLVISMVKCRAIAKSEMFTPKQIIEVKALYAEFMSMEFSDIVESYAHEEVFERKMKKVLNLPEDW